MGDPVRETANRPRHAGDDIPIERVRLRDWVRSYDGDEGTWGQVDAIFHGVDTRNGRKVIELRVRLSETVGCEVPGYVNEHRIEAATPVQARRCDWYPAWAVRA